MTNHKPWRESFGDEDEIQAQQDELYERKCEELAEKSWLNELNTCKKHEQLHRNRLSSEQMEFIKREVERLEQLYTKRST